MSGLLFLCTMAAFVLIAYWSYQNDAMEPSDSGSGLLAMRLSTQEKPVSAPRWKKALDSNRIESPRRIARLKAIAAKPLWRRSFYGSAR